MPGQERPFGRSRKQSSDASKNTISTVGSSQTSNEKSGSKASKKKRFYQTSHNALQVQASDCSSEESSVEDIFESPPQSQKSRVSAKLVVDMTVCHGSAAMLEEHSNHSFGEESLLTTPSELFLVPDIDTSSLKSDSSTDFPDSAQHSQSLDGFFASKEGHYRVRASPPLTSSRGLQVQPQHRRRSTGDNNDSGDCFQVIKTTRTGWT
jgi:hypothetical protein